MQKINVSDETREYVTEQCYVNLLVSWTPCNKSQRLGHTELSEYCVKALSLEITTQFFWLEYFEIQGQLFLNMTWTWFCASVDFDNVNPIKINAPITLIPPPSWIPRRRCFLWHSPITRGLYSSGHFLLTPEVSPKKFNVICSECSSQPEETSWLT